MDPHFLGGNFFTPFCPVPVIVNCKIQNKGYDVENRCDNKHDKNKVMFDVESSVCAFFQYCRHSLLVQKVSENHQLYAIYSRKQMLNYV